MTLIMMVLATGTGVPAGLIVIAMCCDTTLLIAFMVGKMLHAF